MIKIYNCKRCSECEQNNFHLVLHTCCQLFCSNSNSFCNYLHHSSTTQSCVQSAFSWFNFVDWGLVRFFPVWMLLRVRCYVAAWLPVSRKSVRLLVPHWCALMDCHWELFLASRRKINCRPVALWLKLKRYIVLLSFVIHHKGRYRQKARSLFPSGEKPGRRNAAQPAGCRMPWPEKFFCCFQTQSFKLSFPRSRKMFCCKKMLNFIPIASVFALETNIFLRNKMRCIRVSCSSDVWCFIWSHVCRHSFPWQSISI